MPTRPPAPQPLRRAPRRAPSPAVLGVLVLGLALGASPAPSSAVDVSLAQLGFESWTTEKGLAGNWVSSIVETPDGFLWIATSGGLSRFDGTRFRSYTAATEPELPSNLIQALAVDPAGRLWLGLETGGVRVLEDDQIAADPRLASLPDAGVSALAFEPDGTLWVGTVRGLYRWTPAGVENVAPAGEDRAAEIQNVRPAASGGVWIQTRTRGVWRALQGTLAKAENAPECTGFDVSELADGRLLSICAGGLWERQRPDSGWRRIAADVVSSRHLVDRDGAVWFATTEGLARLRGNRTETIPVAMGLGDHRVRALLEDSRGEIWAGSFSGGLARLRRGVAQAFGEAEGLPVRGTTAVLADPDGALWLGSWTGVFYRWDPEKGVLGRWGKPEGLPVSPVWALARDPRRAGHLWVGTGAGLFELESGRLRRVERPENQSGLPVRLIVADGEQVWVGGEAGGLDELGPGGARRHDRRNGLGLDRVMALVPDPAGGWIAGGDHGLFRFDGARWSEIALELEDLHTVRALARAPDGAVWIASDSRGLVRWSRGSAVSFGERDGLPFNQIFGLEVDSRGGLWMSGNAGLVRLDFRDFERWSRGEARTLPTVRLGQRDGLRQRECNGWGAPASSRFADGRLVFPTLDGIAILDPVRLPTALLRPSSIYIDGAWTGPRALDERGTLRLGAHERHLRVRFGALDYDWPGAVAFRYHLEGVEGDWVRAGSSAEAEFAYLPPGKYRFRLMGRLPGQDWVEADRVLAIEVAPRFLESRAVRWSAIAAAVLLALGIFAWRSAVASRHAKRLRSERTFLREVIDTSPNPIFAKHRDLSYVLANRAAAELYGLEPKEVVGRADQEIADRVSGVERLDALDRQVLESGEERMVPEVKLVDAKGQRRWFRVFKRPLRAATGEIDLILGTAVEVSDFKAVEEQLRQRETELKSSQEELRQLTRQLLRAQEEERRKLGREIHDDLTQRLAGLAMLTGGLAQAAAKDTATGVDVKLTEIGHELERLASDTQALSRDLHPALLENLGLKEALRSECATFGERVGLRVSFESHAVPDELPPEVSLGLFRIAQEALRNTSKHARTSRARVRLERREGRLVLAVSDEGVGFSPARPTPGPGIGLASMRERARLIGAELLVASAPGAGTRVEVRLDLEAERKPATPE